MGIRVLVLGANGQLGRSLVQHAKPALLETMDALISYGRDKADLANPDQLIHVLKDLRPDVIINAAAYTQVEQAQLEPDLARAVNATAVGLLAEQAKKQGAVLVHYSTDYVFDGQQTHPYLETDPVNPLSVYGQTKAEGERFLQEIGGNWVIFRTGWVYAHRGGNFCKTMIKLAKERPELNVVDDQHGAPTPASWLAELGLAVAGVAARSRYKQLGKAVTGHLPAYPQGLPSGEIFHASAAGQTTWFDYANMAIELAHQQGIVQNRPAILRAKTADMNFKAPRPAYSVLNTAKLKETFRVIPPDWEKGVRNLVKNMGEAN